MIELPAGPAWWRTTLAGLEQQEADARRRVRELRLELGAAGVEFERARATLAVRERELRELRDERRVLAARNERLARQLAAARATRGYRWSRRWWRIRAALLRPFRRVRARG